MKKFFTLLSAGVMVASAFAAKPMSLEEIKNAQISFDGISEAQIRSMQEMSQSMKMGNEETMFTRSAVIDGVTWNASLMIIGDWTQYGIYSVNDNGDKEYLTFEDLPSYVCQMEVWNDNDNNPTDIMCLLSWPSEYLYTQMWLPQTEFDPENGIGEYDWNIVSPNKLMNDTDTGLNVFKWSSFLTYTGQGDYVGGFPVNWDKTTGEYIFDSWPLIGINAIYSNKSTFNGNDANIAYTTSANENRTEISFEGYNKDNLNVSFFMRAFGQGIKDDILTGQIYTQNLQFDGTAYQVKGFEHMDNKLPAVTELHIFKDKKYTQEELYDALGYESPYDPVTKEDAVMADVFRYYMAGVCSEYLTVASKNETSNVFNSDDIVVSWQKDVPDDAKSDRTNFNFFYGTIYCPGEISDFPAAAKWDMLKFETSTDGYFTWISTYPQGYCIVPNAYNGTAFETDGMWVINNGRTGYTMAPSLMQVGTTEGMVCYFNDSSNDTYLIKYNGKYLYHNDPSDISKFEERTTLGTDAVAENPATAAVENIFTEENETLAVSVDGRNIVAPQGSVIYDLNGRRMNANGVQTGVYVVRNGKQAVKIFVK